MLQFLLKQADNHISPLSRASQAKCLVAGGLNVILSKAKNLSLWACTTPSPEILHFVQDDNHHACHAKLNLKHYRARASRKTLTAEGCPLSPPMERNLNKQDAVLLISCRDRKGIVATVASFLYQHGANIIHSDQHSDKELGLFFMRVEC